MTRVGTISAVVLVVLGGLAAAHTVDAQQPQEESVGPTARVGTFDSRALAIAYRRPEIEFVDVTVLMVWQFDPDAETLEIATHVQAREPVPLEKLGHDDD